MRLTWRAAGTAVRRRGQGELAKLPSYSRPLTTKMLADPRLATNLRIHVYANELGLGPIMSTNEPNSSMSANEPSPSMSPSKPNPSISTKEQVDSETEDIISTPGYAEYSLGQLYLAAYGKVPVDWFRAASMFSRAAALCYPPAFPALALCHVFGRGVPLDLDRAHGLFTHSILNDNIPPSASIPNEGRDHNDGGVHSNVVDANTVVPTGANGEVNQNDGNSNVVRCATSSSATAFANAVAKCHLAILTISGHLYPGSPLAVANPVADVQRVIPVLQEAADKGDCLARRLLGWAWWTLHSHPTHT
jgi:hypothetical protein